MDRKALGASGEAFDSANGSFWFTTKPTDQGARRVELQFDATGRIQEVWLEPREGLDCNQLADRWGVHLRRIRRLWTDRGEEAVLGTDLRGLPPGWAAVMQRFDMVLMGPRATRLFDPDAPSRALDDGWLSRLPLRQGATAVMRWLGTPQALVPSRTGEYVALYRAKGKVQRVDVTFPFFPDYDRDGDAAVSKLEVIFDPKVRSVESAFESLGLQGVKLGARRSEDPPVYDVEGGPSGSEATLWLRTPGRSNLLFVWAPKGPDSFAQR